MLPCLSDTDIIILKYNNRRRYVRFSVPYTTEQIILETDYDSFAVVWSCSSLGVANTRKYTHSTRWSRCYRFDKYVYRYNKFAFCFAYRRKRVDIDP